MADIDYMQYLSHVFCDFEYDINSSAKPHVLINYVVTTEDNEVEFYIDRQIVSDEIALAIVFYVEEQLRLFAPDIGLERVEYLQVTDVVGKLLFKTKKNEIKNLH